MEFTALSNAVRLNFANMSTGELFVANIDKYELWDTYIGAFPAGTDPIFKERTEHDCNCCKQFLRTVGAVVTVNEDGSLTSIWDVDIGGHYQIVADALSAYVKSKSVANALLHYEPKVGNAVTRSQAEDGTVINWGHFSVTLPNKFVVSKDSVASKLSDTRSNGEVLNRSLAELTVESAETVLELIAQNSLYRGAEHKSTVDLFLQCKRAYDALDESLRSNYCWKTSASLKGASKIRNTVIGSLLLDLSTGKELEGSVKSFESKVAPTNYKRTTKLVTAGMIAKAQEEFVELGYIGSEVRRFAVAEDLSINNVIFADRSVKPALTDTPNMFETMISETTTVPKNLDKVEEIGIKDFITNVVPKADNIEIMVSNAHTSNLVSLIAPVDPNSKNMFKWDNKFSWTYDGEVADSMKEHVKNAGGSVTGDLRFSLAWYSRNDLDLHVIEPNGNEIMYNSPRSSRTLGKLDVDNTSGGSKDRPAVENITWDNKNTLLEGRYKVFVRNYSGSNTNESGFDFEMEFGGQIHTMSYDLAVGRKANVACVEIDYTHADGVKIVKSLDFTTTSKEVWGINTETFVKVNMIMNSPKHWDGNETGNKHWFFMIEGCNSGGSARGFFNEFLDEALTPHRKVFEILGSKMQAPHVDNQLSGIGFSSTQRNFAYFKVVGKFTRTVKVIF
jgi:hypothetical protein